MCLRRLLRRPVRRLQEKTRWHAPAFRIRCPPAGFAPPIVHDVLRSPGQPLDAATRAFFEPRLGRDLRDVRTHTGPLASQSALAVNALAYTAGSDIVFQQGTFSTSSHEGRRLLAHELAHVSQQSHLPSAAPSAVLRRKVSNQVLLDAQATAQACVVQIHNEEHTAIAVAQELRERRCVNLLHLDTKDRFLDFDFSLGGEQFTGRADPNRIFTSHGRSGSEAIVQLTSSRSGPLDVKKLPANVRAAAEAELANFANSQLIPAVSQCRGGSGDLPVLAVHNNEGLDPTKFKPSASKDRSPNPVPGDPRNPDDFFFTTQPSDFDALKGSHNVVLQENPIQSKNDDGSLSVFLADQRYINIEKEGRKHDATVKSTGDPRFASHDRVYVRDYSLASEALDLLGVPDGPCEASPDFDSRTRSVLNRRLGQSGRLPTKLVTDKPELPREDFSKLALRGCLVFQDQPALDKRADDWRKLLDRVPLVNMIHWVLGGPDFTPDDALAEFKAQQKCLIDAMTRSLKSQGLSLPSGKLIESGHRTFKDQESIWERKFAFTGPPFDRISDFARTKCASLLKASDVQWNPASKDHKTCWSSLSDDEKQKEILSASSAPGVSRHHTGVDFDFGKTASDLDPQAWTGKGRFADAASWLAHNGSAFGFLQPFDTQGGYGVGYMSERWHWSYYPVAVAAMEFVMDHEAEVEAKLRELWGDGKGGIKPEFSFIPKNCRHSTSFDVEREGVF